MFPLAACIDGGGVWVSDERPIPVRLFLTGDVGLPRTVRAANVTLAADAMWAAGARARRCSRREQVTFVPVGTGAASVTVANDDILP